ncbi:MAG: hypothetical protein QOH21_1482 [Acidobacteriota bacterium]|nr:hypothetical protein [Acidobacteriota bacterium]
MAIILPYGLTTQEFRVLQEFRRLNVETLPVATIKAIKHPAGGGEGPAVSLAGKGYLVADAAADGFALTPSAKALLALDPVPLGEEGGMDATAVVEDGA